MNNYFNVTLAGAGRPFAQGNQVVKVEAQGMEVTVSGALVFYKASKLVVRVFAPGSWKEVEGF